MKPPHDPSLFSKGYHLQKFSVPSEFKSLIKEEQWDQLDAHFKQLVSAGGSFYQFLSQHYDFASIEFIISIRDSANDYEEDGIWHDDGSRVFAFSLSLTEAGGVVEGGHLELRRKGEDVLLDSIPTPDYGTAILFLTGVHGFEHRTRAVLKGRRMILAGWCL